MAYKVTNNAFSTLAGSISNSATALSVATGHGDRFPIVTGADFTYITLEDVAGNIEIVKVSARASTSDTMTIVRGQDGTTARNWASGDIVELRIVAALLDIAIAHVDDLTNAHAASSIGVTPVGNLVATNAQSALQELDADLTTVASNLVAHIALATDAHDASAISYLGSTNISAVNVEAALDELDTEKASIAAIQNQSATAFTTTGTASALVLTPSSAYSAAAEFQQIEGELHVALTGGAVTLQVSAQAAIPVTNPDGSNPLAPLSYKAVFELNSSAAAWILTNPPVKTGLSNFTASVASNILTFTVQPDTLEFRSATLNSGVPQLVSSALATLAIPDTATMGMQAAVTVASATMAGTTTLTLNAAPSTPIQVGDVIFQAGTRIGKVASFGTYIGGVGTGTIILDASATFTAVAIVSIHPSWFDLGRMANGELFVVNRTGGITLDESGFISTTAISTAADNANTIYSTTARTNQAYKLLAKAQIANAVVGTYANAVEAVIPINSATLAMQMGVGQGESVSVLTQHIVDRTYYNLEPFPIFITADGNGSATNTSASLLVNGNRESLSLAYTASATLWVSGFVPSNASYSISTTVGVFTVSTWRIRK